MRATEVRRERQKRRKKLPEGTEAKIVIDKRGRKLNIAGLATPWPKGVSGNPKGRPAGQTLSECYRQILQEEFPGAKHTWAEEIARRMAKLALKRVAVAAEIADRVEGRPKVSVQTNFPPCEAPVLNVQFVEIPVEVKEVLKLELPGGNA